MPMHASFRGRQGGAKWITAAQLEIVSSEAEELTLYEEARWLDRRTTQTQRSRKAVGEE